MSAESVCKGAWELGTACGKCSKCRATAAASQASAHEDVEHFLQQAIDRAPEPLRRLGEYLSRVLDEDQWKTAERMLHGIAAITQEKAS